LAVWALLHIFFGIIDYLGLIVALIDGYMGKGPHPVVFGAAIMDILLRSVRGIFGKGQSAAWRRIFCIRCLLGVCIEWLCDEASVLRSYHQVALCFLDR